MVIKFIKQKWKRIALTITLVIVVIIAVLALLINFYWSPILGDKLKATILKSTDGLYAVNYSKISLHFLNGELVVDNIELTPNMAVYNSKKKIHLAPNSLYSLKIQRLVIHHLHPLNLYFNKKIDIDQIVISQPNLHISYEQNRDQDTVIKNKKTPYQFISKVLKSIHVNTILLNDVKFSYVDNSVKENTIELKEFNLKATDMLIDSTTQKSPSRFLFCKDVSAELNNFSGTINKGRYNYSIDAITFSTLTSQLIATGISFKPAKTVNEFFKGNNDDCYAFNLDSLRLNNFDFKAYSKYHTIHASSATLTNGKFEMFSNPAPNDTTIDQSVNFPQQLLHRLKADVKLDTAVADRVDLFYTEYSTKSDQSGTVTFNRVSGKLFNITNNKIALQKNNIASADMETYFMNRSKLNVNFNFNLTDNNSSFTYKGSLEPINLKYVNPISVPLGMVKLSSGDVKKLNFDIQANKVFATGTLTALYNDLKIKLLKKNDENRLKKMGIMSLLANALIIKRDNPFDNESPRIAHIALQRKIGLSMFSFMWKALFMGLKESVGYDTKTEQTVKQKISDFKQSKLTHDARKAERQQRRAARQQKRELRKQQKELNSTPNKQPE